MGLDRPILYMPKDTFSHKLECGIFNFLYETPLKWLFIATFWFFPLSCFHGISIDYHNFGLCWSVKRGFMRLESHFSPHKTDLSMIILLASIHTQSHRTCLICKFLHTGILFKVQQSLCPQNSFSISALFKLNAVYALIATREFLFLCFNDSIKLI